MELKRSIVVIAILTCMAFSAQAAHAFWVWTPQSKKFINPKNAVKDTPKEQFDWAMSLYDTKDYTRAADEFDKLLKHYESAPEAAEAQFYLGECQERQGKYYFSFQSYQKVVDEYPHSARLDEVIKRQFYIGNLYLTRSTSKLLGNDLMQPTDRAIEILKKVVANSPFGPYADKAQFKLGLAYARSELYDEAIIAFQKILDDYPSSSLVEKAQYQIAQVAFRASLKPAYDSAPTERAMSAFEDLASGNTDKGMGEEARAALDHLQETMAEKTYSTASFYERQKHYPSAVIYYREIVEKYPKTSFAPEAARKIEALQQKIGGR